MPETFFDIVNNRYVVVNFDIHILKFGIEKDGIYLVNDCLNNPHNAYNFILLYVGAPASYGFILHTETNECFSCHFMWRNNQLSNMSNIRQLTPETTNIIIDHLAGRL